MHSDARVAIQDRANKRMTTPIGFKASVHKGDNRLSLLEHSAVGKGERGWGSIRDSLTQIDPVMNDADFLTPMLRETVAGNE